MVKTFDEYYEICDRLKELPECEYVPSDYDLDYMREYFDETFEFIVYITEFHADVEDEYSTKQIQKAGDILYDSLTLTD